MSLPLSSGLSEVGPGGPIVTSMLGANALTESNAQAKYAPYTAYADALSKIAYSNMLPYQIQSTMLSNPMMWMAMKDHPEVMANMMNSFAQSVPKSFNGLPGGGQLPSPGSMSGGLLGMLMGKLTGESADDKTKGTNALNQSPTMSGPSSNGLNSPSVNSGANNSAPLLPSLAGGTSAVGAKMTAPYVQSPYSAGTLIPDPNNPGKFISVPTSKTVTQLQNQLSASQRTIPQLRTLGELWKPFMTIKGQAYLQAARAGNLTGMSDSDLPSQYADAKLSAFTSVESYLKSIGVPVTVDVQQDLKQMIEPFPGENAKGYSARIEKATQKIINDFATQSLQQLGGGFSSNQTNNAQPLNANTQPPDTTTEALKNSPEAKDDGLAQVDLGNNGEAVVEDTKDIGKNHYVKIKGKWYQQ